MNIPKLEHNSYLVTGGAGFIGSHICTEIIKQGKKCICIDSLVAGERENIEHLRESPNFSFYAIDIRHKWLKDLFENVDIVFHNAASKNVVCMRDPHEDLDVNAWGTFNIAKLCQDYKVKKMIHASTGSVYGPIQRSITSEDEHPTYPVSYYGVSKLAGESYLRVFRTLNPDFHYSVLRYYHVYGSRQNSSEFGGVVPIFIRNCYEGKPLVIFGSGQQERSFTYVGDVVKANFITANEERSDGKIYNCASGLSITIYELAQLIRKIMDREDVQIKFAPWRPGDVKSFNIDNRKIKSLGMTFDLDFKKRLQETVEWYLKYFEK